MKPMSLWFKEMKTALAQLDASYAPVRQTLEAHLTDLQRNLATGQTSHDRALAEILPGGGTDRAYVESRIASIRSELEKEQTEIGGKMIELQRKMDGIKSAMAAKTSVLERMNETLRQLEKQSKSLQKEIDERFVIVSMWKWIFGDPERAKLSELDGAIKQQCQEKSSVEAERDRISRELKSNERDLNLCKGSLAASDIRLKSCKDRLARLKKLMKLEDEIEYLNLQIVTCQRKMSQNDIHSHDERNDALQKTKKLCLAIRAEQPQLADAGPAVFGRAETPNDMLAFGRLRLTCGDKRIGYVPRLVPFPIKTALSFGTSLRDRQWIVDFLLRIFQCIPLSQLSITAIDPLQLGKSLPEFQLLLRNKVPFPAERILTRGDEIEQSLSSLLTYVEHLCQKVFVSGITGWTDYNCKNPKNPLPYKLLVMFDLPEQLSDKGALYLSRLVEHGPRCGVLPLLAYDSEKLDERKYAGLRDMLLNPKYVRRNTEIYRNSSMTSLWRHLRYTEEPELPTSETQLREILTGLEEKFRVADRFAGTMEDLWRSSGVWTHTSEEGLETDVGWTSEGNMPVSFRFGDNPAHALLGGSTGSGKSNFLHVIIQSLCHRYSPDELNLYLLDYKDGVEFNGYAEPMLPHARLIAIESDVEYGLAVLRHLCDEHHRRSALFKQHGVRDYASFRKQGLGKLPRLVVIIDEFQRLFEGGRTLADGADVLLKTLLKQARSSGIHLILATQTVRGLQNQSVGELLSNLGCRMALSCPAEDSAILLGSGNTEAETLQKQRDGIINLENGVKSANVRFCIPYADEIVRRRELGELVRRAADAALLCPHTVFRGNALPVLPDAGEFEAVASAPGLGLLLGTWHDFDARPFVVDVTHGGLLIVGFDPKVRRGIEASIFASICTRKDSKVFYYSSRPDIGPDFALPENVIRKGADWDFADLNDLVMADPGLFLIIDTYDYARLLAPPALGSYRRPATPETPWEALKRLADPLSPVHARVILFVENYRRFANSAKELFNLFDLRIGFGLDEDDAGSLVSSGSIAKLKGLQDLTKAVFVDRTKGGVAQFVRPFVDCPLTAEREIGG